MPSFAAAAEARPVANRIITDRSLADQITAAPPPASGESSFERRAALLSFAGKLSRLSRLREFLKFLHASLPKPARSGEMILFYESRHFGLRTVSVRRGRCLEKAAARPWPETKEMTCGDRAARLYLARETGRPFSHVFLLPFPEIFSSFVAASPAGAAAAPSAGSAAGGFSGGAKDGGLRPLLAIEIAGRQSAPQVKHFLTARREMISPVLGRLLLHTGRLRASLLWSRMFDAWKEPLAVLSRPENGEEKPQIIRSNKAFKRLAIAHPKRFSFPPETIHFPSSLSAFPPVSEKPLSKKPASAKSVSEKPVSENPTAANLVSENEEQNFLRLQGRIYKRRCHPLLPGGQTESGILYFQDMTERFHLREKLLQSEKMASIARLGKNMADRLNEPLEEIRALIQPLTAKPAEPDKTLLEMEQAALRCQTIIKSLLSFSGGETAAPAPFPSSTETLVDLNQAVRAALPLLKTALAKPRLSLHLSPKPLLVKGDFSLLQQASFNIILNSCQALEGRRRPELRIQSQYDKKSGKSRLSIQDNGPGLSIEKPEDVFQPFWTGRKQAGGTGLGLSIAQKAVQNCGGDISIETAPDRGACFQIILPAPPPSQAAGAGAKAKAEAVASACRRLKRKI